MEEEQPEPLLFPACLILVDGGGTEGLGHARL